MTVQELINKLREYPPNMQVLNLEYDSQDISKRSLFEIELIKTTVIETDCICIANSNLSIDDEFLGLG